MKRTRCFTTSKRMMLFPEKGGAMLPLKTNIFCMQRAVLKKLILLSLFHLLVFQLNGQTKQTCKSLDLFLLMGQSNMAGYGELLPGDEQEIAGVYVLREGKKERESYFWKEASQPIHDRLPSDRFCLAGPFAKIYREHYPQSQVGLIPMGWGGAAISQMSKGTAFYQEVLSKTLWAQKQGRLKAVLWHQGESDTVSPELVAVYEEKLKQLIKELRVDLGCPNLPVVIGNLAEFYGTGKEHNSPERVKQIDQIKKILRQVAQDLPHVGFVESTGLKSIDHHQVHFDRNSYIVLGSRYADVYWSLTH